MMSPTVHEPANPTNPNIEAIAKMEHEALLRRTPTERASTCACAMTRTRLMSPAYYRKCSCTIRC